MRSEQFLLKLSDEITSGRAKESDYSDWYLPTSIPREINKLSGCYIIKCASMNRYYIGSSRQIRNRLMDHFQALRRNAHHSPLFQSAWNKYGEGDFTCSIICEVPDSDNLLLIEQKLLDESNKDLYLNSNFVADKPPTHKKYGKDNPFYGRHHSEEAKEKMRLKLSGPLNPNFGKPTSQEQKDKRAATIANYSDERRKELAELNRKAQLGRKHSDEAKLKMSIKRKGILKTEEAKEKMRKAKLEWWKKKKEQSNAI